MQNINIINYLNFLKCSRVKKLIDFGAGTGENTVYLANWGAKCTLVEMNDKAQKISKIFKKYTSNFNEHKFIHSSIFDYDSPKIMRPMTLFIVEDVESYN